MPDKEEEPKDREELKSSSVDYNKRPRITLDYENNGNVTVFSADLLPGKTTLVHSEYTPPGSDVPDDAGMLLIETQMQSTIERFPEQIDSTTELLKYVTELNNPEWNFTEFELNLISELISKLNKSKDPNDPGKYQFECLEQLSQPNDTLALRKIYNKRLLEKHEAGKSKSPFLFLVDIDERDPEVWDRSKTDIVFSVIDKDGEPEDYTVNTRSEHVSESGFISQRIKINISHMIGDGDSFKAESLGISLIIPEYMDEHGNWCIPAMETTTSMRRPLPLDEEAISFLNSATDFILNLKRERDKSPEAEILQRSTLKQELNTNGFSEIVLKREY